MTVETHSREIYRVESTTARERVHSPFLTATPEVVRQALKESLSRIEDLLAWPEGWNGYDVAAPNPNAVRHAMLWIRRMYLDALATGKEWHTPHVAADEDGDVMFEWWNNGKGLTIYVSEESATYLMAWGTSMINQMEDGEAATSEARRRLWTWLLS